MTAAIQSIEYHIPEKVLTNHQLAAEHPEWNMAENEKKTGILQRHIAADGECSSDLGAAAAKKLFSSGSCLPEEIDYILFCTQSPDYFLPTTACVVQKRLNIPQTAGAVDINLGCSGYIYGLGIAKGLVETGQAKNVLFITAETYTKFIHENDRSVRTLFGDGAAATLISTVKGDESSLASIGPFVYGTDGGGANNLIVANGGMRSFGKVHTEKETTHSHQPVRTNDNLYMNGSEIFTFTLRSVPEAVRQLMTLSQKTMEEIDLFVFHQANKFMLEHLRKKIRIPEEKFYLAYEKFGNTVSASIPIAIKEALKEGRIKPGDCIMLVGFGVGYSWGAALINWV